MDENNKRNKRKSQKLKMNKIWIQEQNILPEGMLDKIYSQKKIMKDSVDLLNEEIKLSKHKNNNYNFKKKDFKRSSSTKIMEGVSPKARNILLKIGKHIRRMKQSISDITKMNGLYLEQNATNTFRLENNKNKTLSKLNFKNYQLDDFLKKDINIKEKNNDTNLNNLSDNEDIYGEKHKKEDYIKNFMYVNDNYRKQLNCAFLKYNPISHLENLKILIQADPSIRKDISKIKEEVEEDIKWKCDKFHFRKKYLNFISKYPRSNSVQQLSNTNRKKEKRKILPNIIKKKYLKQNIISPQHSKTKTNNFFEKIKKRENQKYNIHREQKIEEINHMLKVTKEIDNLIKEKNINDKIDLYKTEYAKKMYFLNKDEINDNNSLINKDYFSNDKKRVIDRIGDVYSFQVAKIANEKERKLKGKISSENEQLNKKIVDGKRNTMEEFFNFMENNQVKILKEENN